LVYSFLLSDTFCILKAVLFLFLFLAKKQRRSGGKKQKEQGSATDHIALLGHITRALANQIVGYIPLIL
jgi:hypothetical protein